MRWASRVKLGHVSRLYDLAKIGIYDDELLLEVGWGLYARCRSILTVKRAVERGEIPCPQCGETVYRHVKHQMYLERKTASRARLRFPCPGCNRELTWYDCREALRHDPKCFVCQLPLDWHYAENKVRCSHCMREWTWKQYRESISRRKLLPCPHCGTTIRRPEKIHRYIQIHDDLKDTSHRQYECPRCRGRAVHTRGKLQCFKCGYEQSWKSYRRRAEHLKCASCNYEFTWNSWRRNYRGQNLLVGGLPDIEEFLSRWLHCKTSRGQLRQIDMLLHALHARGALGPAFLAGNMTTVAELLDRLAQH